MGEELYVDRTTGAYFLYTLVNGARQFRTDSDGKVLSFLLPHRSLRNVSTWSTGDSWGVAGVASAVVRSGGTVLTMAGLETAGMLTSGLGILAMLPIGLAQIGEADVAGEQIAELSVWFRMYVATYVARLISPKIIRQARPGLTAIQRTLRARAVEDAGRALEAMGKNNLLMVADYLKTYGSDRQIINELLRRVEWHVARFIPHKVSQYLYFSL